MVWKNFKKNKKKNIRKIKIVEITKIFKESSYKSPVIPKITKKIKRIKKPKKLIVKFGNGKKDLKIQQNLFKITDPILLKVGIRNSIDRLTGKKIKNSFAEKQEILLKRGLMRFNQKKSYKFKKKKDFELAPNFKKIMQVHKGKKFFRKLKKSIVFKKMKWKQFNLFYFKSKGLVTENKKSWKNIKINRKITKIKLPSAYILLKKLRAKKKSNIERILNKLNTNKNKAVKLVEAKLSKFREKLIHKIHDNARLVSTPIRQKSFKFLQNSLTKNYINFDNQYNKMYNGSLIKNSQEIYLQSKLKNLANKNQWGYNNLTTDLKDSTQFAKQETEYFNNFLKQCFYKNLLFRSFWFNKFISTLIKYGKKQMVWRNILKALTNLKIEFGKNPILILFEILEIYRMPLKALPPKDKTKKVIVRTHMVSWWKQYTQILRWLRHSFTSSVKNHISWNYRIITEMGNLLNLNHNTLIKKKCDVNVELIAFGKVNLHFRWYRRFSKRAANAIKIIDGPLYNKDN